VSRPPTDSPRRLDQLPTGIRRRLIARTVATSTVVMAAILTAYYVVPWNGGPVDVVSFRILVVLAALVIIFALSYRYVTQSEYPMLTVFHALAAVVGFALVSFASIYNLLSMDDAATFSEPLSRTDALYFSLTTMTTIGYGDIHAKTGGARIVVMIQMVVDVVVVGVAVRALFQEAQRQVEGE
jgi:hypothetical protein